MKIQYSIMACFALLTLLGSGAAAQDNALAPESAIITLLTRDIHVAADGTSTETMHLEVRANDEAAAVQVSKASYTFNGAMQDVEITDAHTLKADGKTVAVDAAAIYEQMPAGQQALLTSLRSKVIVFPQFSAGDTAVYTVRLVTRQPFFQGQFTEGAVFPRTVAYGEVRQTITAPKSLPLYVENHEVEFSKRDAGADTIYRWRYSAPKSAAEEKATLSPLDHMPHFFVSSFKDYAELGNAYAASAESKHAVTPKVRALADELTAGLSDRKMQTQKLYEWVSARIRYVAIELGTGSFVPHDADTVLANGYGDCKDHDVLLQALLKAKGIAAQSILINGTAGYTLTEVATFTTLNHVITFIPEFDLYLDSTAAVAPFGILPMQEYGKPMVIASTASSALGKMPLLAPGVAKIFTKTIASLSKSGELTGTTTTTASGPYVITLRTMGLGIQALGPTAAAKLLTQLGYNDADGRFTQDSPVALTPSHTISGNFKILGWSELLSGDTTFFLPGGLRLFGLSGDGIMGPFRPEKIREESTLCFSAEASEELSLKAPAGLQFEEVPKDTRVETPNLMFTAHWSLDGDTLSVHRNFTSKIDQQFCTGRVFTQTSAALKKIADSYDTNISFKKPGSGNPKPDEGAAAYNSGAEHLKQGEYDLAIQDFGKMIALNPDNVAGYTNRASAYGRKKEYDKAILDYDKAVALNPDEASSYYWRGVSHSYLLHYDLALQDFNKAIVLKPDDATAYFGRASMYGLQKEFDKAAQDFDKAIALKSDDPSYYYGRAMIRSALRQRDLAIEDFSQTLKLNSNSYASYVMRGREYLTLGKDASAIADESEALRLQPDDVGALMLRGSAYIHSDSPADAVADFTRVIALKPDQVDAYLQRAKAREKLGQKAEADQDIQQAIKLDPRLDPKHQ